MTDEERNERDEQREEGSEESEEGSEESAEGSEERKEESSSSSDDDGDDGGDGGGGETTVGDVMTKDPVSVEPGDSIEDAAKAMKEKDTGALLVVDGDELKGIVTDRDVATALGEGNADAKVGDVASTDTTTIKPDDSLADAIKKMREADVRRLPVVEDDGDKPVGIVSLGDLAIAADDDSALKDISEASANN
jgi:CBS domain-containing protein